MNFWFLWFLLIFLPLLLGIYLIWQKTGLLRALGWFIVLMLAYYQLHWISPWDIVQGSEKVQEFKLNDIRFGPSAAVKWSEDSKRLLILRDEDEVYKPEGYKYALVVDLKVQQTYWQPIAELNLDATKKVESLETGYREQRDGLNLYYASALKEGPRVAYSAVGFSLPILNYKIPFYSEISGWQWEKTDFYWKRGVVRESDSGAVLVKLNRIVLNDNEYQRLYGGTSAWVMEGKFLIIEPARSPDLEHRVLGLGPFNTSQTTQSKNNNSKE